MLSFIESRAWRAIELWVSRCDGQDSVLLLLVGNGREVWRERMTAKTVMVDRNDAGQGDEEEI